MTDERIREIASEIANAHTAEQRDESLRAALSERDAEIAAWCHEQMEDGDGYDMGYENLLAFLGVKEDGTDAKEV
jgi:hypothetical protein